MNLDDELTRAVDTLGERLRDDLARELRLLTEQLVATATANREAAASAVEHSAAPAAPILPETGGPGGADRGAGEWLLAAVRAIDDARSLTGVLEALVDAASREAARAGVLLVRGGLVRGRRFAGFPASFDGAVIDTTLEESGIIAVAVEEGRVASSAHDGPAPSFAGLGPDADGTEAVAFPIALGGEVVAVLYADQPDAEPGILTLDLALLEVLARHAARALEALTAFKTARALVRADTGSMAVVPFAKASLS